MVKELTLKKWVYEHYVYYLCLCITDCDCIVTDADDQFIHQLFFPSLSNERFDKLKKEVDLFYMSHTSDEKMSFIKTQAAHYLRTLSIRNQVCTSLEKLTNHQSEQENTQVMYRYIRKTISTLNA
jgi:hypothetical protein